MLWAIVKLQALITKNIKQTISQLVAGHCHNNKAQCKYVGSIRLIIRIIVEELFNKTLYCHNIYKI